MACKNWLDGIVRSRIAHFLRGLCDPNGKLPDRRLGTFSQPTLRKNCDGQRMYPTQVDKLSGIVDRFIHRAQEDFALGQYFTKQGFHFSNQRTTHCFRLATECYLDPVQPQIEATLYESAPEHVSKPSRRWLMCINFPYQGQLHEPVC